MRNLEEVVAELKARYAGKKDNIVNRLSPEHLREAIKLVIEAKEHSCTVENYFLIWCKIAEQRHFMVFLGFSYFADYSDEEVLRISEAAAAHFLDFLFRPITEELKNLPC